MELIDALDSNGNKTGEVKTKREIYESGDFHRTVHVWIINDKNEILVQKRNPKKGTFPNLWAISVAGHVRSGETSVEAALRELKEEIGQKLKEDDLKYLFTVKRKQPFKEISFNAIDDVYLVKLNLDVENTKLQFSELTDIKYVYYEYLEQIFKNHDKEYVPYNEEHKLLFKYLNENLK